MPLTPEFVTRTTATLQSVRPVRIKRMFGGLGIYLDEAFFGIADDDRLYFKVNEATAGKYEAKGMGPWITPQFQNDKYREVPAEVTADPSILGEWIDESAEVARNAKAKKAR